MMLVGINLQELEKLKHEARQIVRSQSSTNTPNSSQDAKPSSDTTSKSRIRIQFKDPKTIDFDELVTIRRAWDQHLVPPGTTPGSSRIPPVRSSSLSTSLMTHFSAALCSSTKQAITFLGALSRSQMTIFEKSLYSPLDTQTLHLVPKISLPFQLCLLIFIQLFSGNLAIFECFDLFHFLCQIFEFFLLLSL